ncbi:hypothetical protein [Gymnodinialimonas sp.]
MDRVEALDPTSRALVPVLRNFVAAFLAPDSMGWRHAFAAAVGTWGEARGLALAHLCQEFVYALLQSRPVPLAFADPMDLDARATLTLDERTVLALLLAMSRDEPARARARDLIAKLTGGRVEAAVVRTGLALAARLDPVSDHRPVARPKLQLVG